MNPPLNEPPPDGPLLEPSLNEGVYPGGLVQLSQDTNALISTDADLYHLGYRDELGPSETFLVGPFSEEDLSCVNGRVVSSSGETIYVVDLFLKAGTARRHYCRSQHLNNNKKRKVKEKHPAFSEQLDNQDVGRGRRSRADLILLARTNELGQRVNLDYADKLDRSHRYPKSCDLYMSSYLRRIRRKAGSFPWLEVLEYGGETLRLHHHLLVPTSIDEDLLREKWTHGGTTIERADSLNDVGILANYVTKTFEQPPDMRPRSRRYRVARCTERERPIRLIGTYEDIQTMAYKLVPKSANPKEWQSEHPFSAGGFTWNRRI